MTRQTPQWLQNGNYAAARDRMLLGALWPAAAVAGLAVTAGTGMVCNIAAGQAAVPSANNTGSTLCTSDAGDTVTISAAPASGYSRIDVVTVHPRGNDLDGGANDDWIFDVIVGAVVQSPTVPTAPAVPAGQLALAQITVPGGAAAIVAGNIADVRAVQQLAVPRGMAGLTRVIYEARLTANSAAIGATETVVPGFSYTFTPRAGVAYYFRYSMRLGVSASLFPVVRLRAGVATGTLLAQILVVAGNAAGVSFDISVPMQGLTAGTPVTAVQTLQGSSAGTSTQFGDTTQPGLLQVLARDDLGAP